MSVALEAYKRAFHCGVGGHDGHLEEEKATDPHWQVYDDRCALALQWSQLRSALRTIANIPNKENGGDWDEIELARTIAKNALGEGQ